MRCRSENFELASFICYDPIAFKLDRLHLYSQSIKIMSQNPRRTRSHPEPVQTYLSITSKTSSIHTSTTDQPSITKRFFKSTISEQRLAVSKRFAENYPNDRAKDLQLDTVVSLLNGDNTFLLARTGFGKSRVAELLFLMFARSKQPVVLVLNPLDALGNNQVCSLMFTLNITWRDMMLMWVILNLRSWQRKK